MILFLFTHGIPISYIPSTRIPPTERNFAVMDYLESLNALILFSGGLLDGTYTNDLWSFNLTSNYWSEIVPTSSTLPGISQVAERANSGCFASKCLNYFYIFGGNSELGPSNDFWVYDFLNYKWLELYTINPPSPRCRFGFTSFTDGTHEYFVVFGGSLFDTIDNDLYM